MQDSTDAADGGDDEPAAAQTRGATGAVSAPDLVAGARRLRRVCRQLEALVWIAIVGSVAVLGAVHPWAYVWLWLLAVMAAVMLLRRALVAQALRRVLGRHRLSFHSSERWLVLDARERGSSASWSFDLDRPLLPPVPLLAPGIVFLCWVALQLVPLHPSAVELLSPRQPLLARADPDEWRALTVNARDTWRGIGFVVMALVLHAAGATAFERRHARRRLRRGLAMFGLVLAAIAFAQVAMGNRHIYGVYAPDEGTSHIFGPFVNRNHFAGYMLMLAPMGLALLSGAASRYRRRIGSRPNLRRRLVALGSSEGVALIYASVPALAAAGALVATGSRAALVAFLASLVLAGLSRASARRASLSWLVALTLGMLALGWFGAEQLKHRFGALSENARLRTAIWTDAIQGMDGLWLTGSGFNTFAWAVSRATPWRLPIGATPWLPDGDAAIVATRVGFRVPEGINGLGWYREAHSDYVQLLVETGAPGLLIAVWGAIAVLWAIRRDPWLLAAVAAVLIHVTVDFDLQIPAIAVLLAVLAGVKPLDRDAGDEPEPRRA